MEIIGIEALNKNDYDSIVIGEQIVNIDSKSNLNTIKSDFQISDYLQYLSDLEKKKSITEYFLRYNRINLIDNTSSEYITLISSAGKSLTYFDFFKDLNIKIVFDKYKEDRIASLYQTDYKEYNLSMAEGCSSYLQDHGESNKVNIKLYSKNGKLIECEKEFLELFLPTLFGEDEVIIEQKKVEFDEYTIDEFYIILNEKLIKIDKTLLPYVITIIAKHNCQVKLNDKVLQLKMEGF